MDKCKRCGLPQVEYPIFVDEQGYPLEKEKTVEKIKKLDFSGAKWINLIKMKPMDLTFIVIILALAFSYSSETQVCRDFQSNPCPVINSYIASRACEKPLPHQQQQTIEAFNFTGG